MDLSVVIPLFDEAESLGVLHEELLVALRPTGLEFELVYVDDGSTDGSLDLLRRLHAADPGHVRVLSFRRNHGKSAAMAAGFAAALGASIATLDADLQDDPAEIPKLLAVLDEGADLVCGWKRTRRDPWSKRLPSKLFNAVTARASGVRLHDFNTGLKVYRADVVRDLHVYGELHRFVPVLAAWQGFVVREVPVHHRPRLHGRSKFGAARFLNGFLDLVTVMFITRGGRSPLHFFGTLVLGFFFVGLVVCGYFAVLWLQGHGLRVRPLMLLGIGFVIVAIQIGSMGLLAEMLSAQHAERQTWSFRERLGMDAAAPARDTARAGASPRP